MWKTKDSRQSTGQQPAHGANQPSRALCLPPGVYIAPVSLAVVDGRAGILGAAAHTGRVPGRLEVEGAAAKGVDQDAPPQLGRQTLEKGAVGCAVGGRPAAPPAGVGSHCWLLGMLRLYSVMRVNGVGRGHA